MDLPSRPQLISRKMSLIHVTVFCCGTCNVSEPISSTASPGSTYYLVESGQLGENLVSFLDFASLLCSELTPALLSLSAWFSFYPWFLWFDPKKNLHTHPPSKVRCLVFCATDWVTDVRNVTLQDVTAVMGSKQSGKTKQYLILDHLTHWHLTFLPKYMAY